MTQKTFVISERMIETSLSHLKPNTISAERLIFDPAYRTIRSLLFFSNAFETHEAVDRYLLDIIK